METGLKQLQPSILAIDDESRILSFLRASLASQGYKIIEAATGESGLSLAASHVPDLILLDLGLPDMDGVELLRKVRDFSRAPVIVLSARGQERDKIDALDAGADDYITKPFGVGELLARIRVALRHAVSTTDSGDADRTIFEVGQLRVDLEKREVYVGEREVHLTPIEYRLLTCMIQKAGRVLTHNYLLREVWGPGSADRSEYLRVYMGNLRRKIEENPADPLYILTEIGVGYRLNEHVDDAGG